MSTIIRPNWSSPEIAARAASIKFEPRLGETMPIASNAQYDVSWLPRKSVPNSASTIVDKTVDLNPIEFKSIGCQECLIYLSKCYCVEAA